MPLAASFGFALLLSAAPAAATGDKMADRWIPSVNVSFDVYEEHATGEVHVPAPPPTYRFADVEKNPDTVTGFRFGAELLSPELESLFDFRVLMAGGLQLLSDQSQAVSKAGGKVITGIPQCPITQPTCNLANAINQGSEVTGMHENPGWYLQLGTSYSIPWNDFLIRLKPSFEYFGEKVGAKGRHFQVLQPGPVVASLRGENENQVQHSIGPAFELEGVIKQDGWVTVSIFGQVRYLWDVSDREYTFTDDNTSTLVFKYRRPSNSFRGGAGIRLGWRGPLLDK